ncbi:Mg2+-importing ATPase [Mycobacterium frederiksbergense]|uniref:Magnesium-transporting ATPase, P-type 1 n=1 Tax=Mycolicibacterium frederiksbergense TaxID=117567 RepID=A0ABT6L3P1_9MYCO|nr:magnesium-translocating P-type ATPase [Mycolicibacterium frederiksbergense]MDH6197539.1 Mg2+-importing ATPase [Mycolicibacterium frederiksbergense]
MTTPGIDRSAARFDTGNHVTPLRELAEAPVFTVFQQMAATPSGLTEAQAADRLHRHGDNLPPALSEDGLLARTTAALRSPFIALLSVLAVVFVAVGDPRGSTTVAVMVALAVGLRLWQQTRSVRATRQLRTLASATATVRRRADDLAEPLEREVPVSDLVPGDIVLLRAGDVVAADLRVLSSTDLLVDQSVLSGEALPVRKGAPIADGAAAGGGIVDSANLCFAGSAVVAGSATAVVVATGGDTYSGSLAHAAAGLRPESSFDSGVRAVGWTLIRFMLVLVPIVFVVNGAVSGIWTQAAMFAVAVAVGLTPEMLPVIVTSNLARGATRLARDRVVVSRLNAIQDLGAVEVLCVDKTGTLTEDRVVYANSIDVTGRIDHGVAEFAYLAAFFADESHDRLDAAICEMLTEQGMPLLAEAAYDKVDEIAFDPGRRRSSVVVRRQPGEHVLICKGDPDRVLPQCSRVWLDQAAVTLSDDIRLEADDLVQAYRKQGMRVLAVAARPGPARLERYGADDETDLVLVGFVGFVDPVRVSAAPAVSELADCGVQVKILTGDSAIVARQVAGQVGVDPERVLVGAQIDRIADHRLAKVAADTSVFAELGPGHKLRIVTALRQHGCAVGFLGDGVNDVAALRTADAGIAADTATDAAKDAADVILLDKDLQVVVRAVIEGRRTLANTMKYVKITAASNFGNVLSVVAASVFLPFLPMLPVQLMVQNLLYDTAQLALPWDRVERDYLRAPRRWPSDGLVGFMVVFGVVSSLFDLATFAMLWWVFGAGQNQAMFHAGWFVEGLLTQLAVVLVLRSKAAPLRGDRPARIVVAAAAAAASVGLVLGFTPLAGLLDMSPLPITYAVWLIASIVAYGFAAHAVKRRYLRRRRSWL